MGEAFFRHVEKEETELFPKAKELLSHDQLSQIVHEFQKMKKEMEEGEIGYITV